MMNRRAFYALDDCGVEVWYYADRQRVSTETAMHRGMLGMKATFAAAEREAAQQRTREAMRSKAQRGHVAGGMVYGFRNVRTAHHVEREIVAAEAHVIVRIFEEIAAGRGFAKVAKGLNADAVQGPRGRRWAMTCIREMVSRELYRGRLVYGKTQWQYRKGRKFKVRAPESAWIIRQAEALRIVSDELWARAHARLERTRQTYLRQTGGKLYGRPESGLESRHLLSGFVLCGCCQGSMHAIRRTSKRGRPRVYYTCNNARVNGACINRFSVAVDDLDRAVVHTIVQTVLTPDVVEDVVTRALEIYTSESDVYAEQQERFAGEAQRLHEEIGRLTSAIAAGGSLASLLEALKAREGQRVDMLARLEHLDGLAKAPTWDENLRAEIRRRLTAWSKLLHREPEVARQLLRRLLVGRLTLTPNAETREYEVRGEATYGQLFEGLPIVVASVPPG